MPTPVSIIPPTMPMKSVAVVVFAWFSPDRNGLINLDFVVLVFYFEVLVYSSFFIFGLCAVQHKSYCTILAFSGDTFSARAR